MSLCGFCIFLISFLYFAVTVTGEDSSFRLQTHALTRKCRKGICRDVQCDPPCGQFADCTKLNECTCQPGYRRTQDEVDCQPFCEADCGTHGFCRAPNKCECLIGYVSIVGTCQKVCGQDKIWNTTSMQCISLCRAGSSWQPDIQKCVQKLESSVQVIGAGLLPVGQSDNVVMKGDRAGDVGSGYGYGYGYGYERPQIAYRSLVVGKDCDYNDTDCLSLAVNVRTNATATVGDDDCATDNWKKWLRFNGGLIAIAVVVVLLIMGSGLLYWTKKCERRELPNFEGVSNNFYEECTQSVDRSQIMVY